MDTKDLIIIAGSIFFVLIVAHGLWVTRRQRLDEIRMDIEVTDNLGETSSDNFSSELPNGGARVISEALKSEADESRGKLESNYADVSTTSTDSARKATDHPSSTAENRSKEPSIGQRRPQKICSAIHWLRRLVESLMPLHPMIASFETTLATNQRGKPWTKPRIPRLQMTLDAATRS